MNYLDWALITREERFFCSHLYHAIIGKEKEFIQWLSKEEKIFLNDNSNWQINFEVCFYRDFLKANGETIKAYNVKNNTNYPPKRTFDLCLFSEDVFVIIEAKVQQGFSVDQINEIDLDEKLVKQIVKTISRKNVDIKTILLYSSRYSPQQKQIRKHPFITWQDLNSSPFKYKNYFELANEKFRK